jgi:hypothetical protein
LPGCEQQNNGDFAPAQFALAFDLGYQTPE